MRIIETKEVQPRAGSFKSSESSSAGITNFEHLFIKTNRGRLLAALFKGAVVSSGTFAVSGFPMCVHNYLLLSSIACVSVAFFANEYFEQRVSGTRLLSDSAHFSLRSISPVFAAIPLIFLLSTMNLQTLAVALCNTIEVIGIACGVPFILYGLITLSRQNSFGKVHVYMGSVSAFGGVALSVAVNLVIANVTDMSIFSATNYFSNAIAAIYAPDVVLPVDR